MKCVLSFGAPPHTSNSVPVQTPTKPARESGAPAAFMSLHVSVAGSYRPEFELGSLRPSGDDQPRISISEPVHAEIAEYRGPGAPRADIGVHLFAAGS